jgi:RibD C-terminal domain
MKLTLHTFLTLDGVMQAPGGPGEDTDGHFEHGGWSFPYGDENFGSTMVGWFANADAFLMGRKTYEILSDHRPHVTDPDNPIATKLNALPKYVASHSLGSVDWLNSSLLGGDVVAEVTKLSWRAMSCRCMAAALQLTNTKTTGTGVVIATYRPAGPARYGSHADSTQQPP